MTLPKKNRRKIVVEGDTYYYVVRFDRSERAVIQLANSAGALLFVLPFAILKPKHIVGIIKIV